MKAELPGGSTTPPPTDIFTTVTSSSSSCIEKLLLHCATALEAKDITLAQQVMWVLNSASSPTGEPNQRLAYWFLIALISRASKISPTTNTIDFHHRHWHRSSSGLSAQSCRPMTVTELAGYVDLMPWYRFGFSASNTAILSAIQGCQRVHILDFSTTYCMQWPTFIDDLSKRDGTGDGSPPRVRISVPHSRPQVPPFLNVPIEEVGLKLANFAKSKGVPLEFHVMEEQLDSDPSVFGLRNDEALVVNCQNWLRYLADEPNSSGTRDGFLDMISELDPCIVTVVDEDIDLDAPSLSSRTIACFNYLWIPFDALETFLAKDSSKRMDYEADIGRKIENVVGFEGESRTERPESFAKLEQRMKRRGRFAGVPFGEETVAEVKRLLDEHAGGWGMKKEGNNTMVLTWKGHSSVFATAWVPNPSGKG